MQNKTHYLQTLYINMPLSQRTTHNYKAAILLNRKKPDPGKFIFTGRPTHETTGIQLFSYSAKECIERSSLPADAIPTITGNGYCNWLNIHGISDTEMISGVCRKLGIHDLVIQDILDVNQRPKFQEYDDYSFLTLKSIVPSEGEEVITEQISIVFGPDFVVSFQERRADFFEHLRIRLREDKGIVRQRPADYLLYALLESILDNYFKTLSRLDDKTEQLNLTDFKRSISPDVLVEIENHKKLVHFIKKSIFPIKEFARQVERGECSNIEKRHKKYFLEIKDLCLTLIDSSDMLLSSLESATNLFFSLQGHRMNEVMKTLTIVATIFIPLTFVAGIYGMNFVNMPELQWKYGYPAIWIIMLCLLAGMLIYFKRKKWF